MAAPLNFVNIDRSVFNIQHNEILKCIQGPNFIYYIYVHQREALLAVKNQLDDVEQPNIALVVLPTGCGKTGVAVLAPYVLDSRRVLVLTPSNTISEQIYKAFCNHNEESMFLVQRGMAGRENARNIRPKARLIDRPKQIHYALDDDLLVITAHQVGGNALVRIDDIPADNFDLVIVDEAHHYPAETWATIVNHFPNSKRLFLTATPYYKGRYILESVEPATAGLAGIIPIRIRIDACYTLNLQDAVSQGIIRNKRFDELGDPGDDEITAMKAVAIRISEHLNEHDQLDPAGVPHQAMVLTQTIEGINSAQNFIQSYNRVNNPDQCEMYVGNASVEILQRFQNGETRTLVVVDRLREGYDNKRVSVVAIVRNVGRKSTVLFAQFVGRAIRKVRHDDPVTAVVIAHRHHNQRQNYEQFDQVNDEANDD